MKISGWNNAKKRCQESGMKLVELESNKEQLEFIKIMNEHRSIFNGHSYYMGGIMVKDVWYWESSMTKISFPLMWHQNAPDNTRGNENCLIAQKRSEVNGVKFDDLVCEEKTDLICEKFTYDNL